MCVRPFPGTSPAETLATIVAADRAWGTLTDTLSVPPPDGGIDGPWSLYLVDAVDGGGTARALDRDPIAHFDRAASFALVDRTTLVGCALDLAVARAVARGALWQAAPATDEGSARAEAETLARLATPCAGDTEAHVFQAEPERAIVEPTGAAFDRGASLFFDWLDATFASEPGALVAGVWALSPTQTPPASTRWSGRPNGFDVLRVSLKNAVGTESTIEDVFARFAVERALARAPVQTSWHIPWPTGARRLASPLPVSPTGASYVLVDHAGAPPGAKLRVEAEWEDYERMRWAVIKLDAAGHAKAVLSVTSLPRGTHASLTVEMLDDVDQLLVVGANVANTLYPFDPDQAEWEPHGWLLTVEGE